MGVWVGVDVTVGVGEIVGVKLGVPDGKGVKVGNRVGEAARVGVTGSLGVLVATVRGLTRGARPKAKKPAQ